MLETVKMTEFASHCLIRYSDHNKDTQVIHSVIKQENTAC